MTPIEELILRRFELLEYRTMYAEELVDFRETNPSTTWEPEYFSKIEDIARVEHELKERVKDLELELDYVRWSN